MKKNKIKLYSRLLPEREYLFFFVWRVEIALENMRVDLSTTSSENQSLSSNVAELQLQLNDLLQQQLQVPVPIT